jgi:hypothetical protein
MVILPDLLPRRSLGLQEDAGHLEASREDPAGQGHVDQVHGHANPIHHLETQKQQYLYKWSCRGTEPYLICAAVT